MDLTNISLLVIPIGITIIQNGIYVDKNCSNFIMNVSIGTLYSLIGIMLSYMKVMRFEHIDFKIGNRLTLDGFEFMICFLVFFSLLLLVNHTVIHQIENKILKTFISSIIMCVSILLSFCVVYYEYFLI